MSLEKIGFTEWFRSRWMESGFTELLPGRIVRVDKHQYLLHDGEREMHAELSGKFIYNTEDPSQFPNVGDWVLMERHNQGTLAIIHHALPRRSSLSRKSAGKKVESQLIAANVDTAFIMQSCDSNFNIRRLERCLILAREGDVDPVILLSKADLLDGDEVGKLKERIREAGIRVPVMSLSSLDGEGIGEFVSKLEPLKTYCLIGSSGVGKSTLLNKLIGEERLETRSVREKDHHGRHTTTSRQLFRLESGSLFIDTPGMREIGLLADEAEVEECFEEIHTLAAECRFRDCSHLQETGCAVLKALEDGTLQQDRYDSFLKLRRETRFHQMSYVEKRKQDKRFGKMVNTIMKDVRQRKR